MLSETSDDFTAFNELLEPMEICCQRVTRRWNERKFLASKRQNARTIGNSLPANNETLEPSEIHSQQATGCWNRRKFVASKRRDARTVGNSFTANDEALERAEIIAGLRPASEFCLARTARIFVRFATKNRQNSQSVSITECWNLRKLSQGDALLTSQGVALLTEFSYGKLARGVGKA